MMLFPTKAFEMAKDWEENGLAKHTVAKTLVEVE